MTTNGGAPPVNNSAELMRELHEVFTGPFIDVDPNFALVHDIPTEPMEEVILAETENRFIVLSNVGQAAVRHTLLAEARLPVFSGMASKGLLLLNVPPGTRPLRQVLPGVIRSPRNGTALFCETGKVVRDIEGRGLGFPISVLNQFAIVTDAEDPRGVKVCMVPPYELDEQQSLPGFLDQTHAELDFRGVGSRIADQLVANLRMGFHSNE